MEEVEYVKSLNAIMIEYDIESFCELYGDDIEYTLKNPDIIIDALCERSEAFDEALSLMDIYIISTVSFETIRFYIADHKLNEDEVLNYEENGIEEKYLCLEYENLKDVIKYCYFEENIESVVIKYKDVYYLIIKDNPEQGKFENLKRYAKTVYLDDIKLAMLKEHGTQIIKKNAIETLNHLRRCK